MKKPAPATTKPLPWTRLQRLYLILWGAYTLFLAGLLSANALGPERFWLVLVNLYLPQLVWAAPALCLIPLALVVRGKRPWLIALPLIPLLLVLGPLMGLRGYPSPRQPQADGPTLRVMTYNIQSGTHQAQILQELLNQRPDLVFIQEFRPEFEPTLREALADWHLEINGEFVVASRLPLSQFQRIDLPRLQEDKWKLPAYVRAVVRFQETDIVIYNTHLSTPRNAFEALRGRENTALPLMAMNTHDRLAQGKALAQALAQETLPTILGGDFNAPEASLVCQPLTQVGFRNAFSEGGKGYGYTKGHDLRFNTSFVRIDHLYVSKQWSVRSCAPGSKEGSDHRPLVAELALALR